MRKGSHLQRHRMARTAKVQTQRGGKGEAKVCSLVITAEAALSRITITLDDDQHRSLKLLSILENKTLAQVLQEAVHDHLQRKGADRLEVIQGQQPGTST